MTSASSTSGPSQTQRTPVAVLGATGAVGQTFIRLLANHPWFVVTEVAASERSAGKSYAEATRWLEGDIPSGVANLTVKECTPEAVTAPIIFSALDSSVAGDAEAAFARAGRIVFSNAKNHRMLPDVPLLIPEVNANHIAVLEAQRKNHGWSGAILTNANCAATVAALALAPLHQRYGIKSLFLATMQAVSGAGYPGVPSLDILGNVIPYITDEEPKLEAEMGKLLGTLGDGAIQHAPIAVTSHTNRVPVEHGHTVCMSIGLVNKCSPEEARQTLLEWQGAPETLNLPSRPAHPIIVSDQPNRPQPRRDVGSGGGMSVTVGRIRPDNLLDLRLVAMGSNTIRGAAGGSILNAELLASCGMLPR
jgi:aspartate-semialdehyde dehydrogenase